MLQGPILFYQKDQAIAFAGVRINLAFCFYWHFTSFHKVNRSVIRLKSSAEISRFFAEEEISSAPEAVPNV